MFRTAFCTCLMLACVAEAQTPCDSAWSQQFAAPAVSPVPNAMIEFDFGDGAGSVLVGGGLKTWNGMVWQNKGAFTGGEVLALAVFDDGSDSGPTLFVGGTFQFINGQSKPSLVKWDVATQSWQTLGGSTNAGVHALAVWDDGSGSGPALYAGGAFTTIAGQPADRLAKWNGTICTEVGDGVQGGSVWSLAVHDDSSGNGPALFVGGEFTTAGTLAANRIAKWAGPRAGWSALGSGVTFIPFSAPVGVYAMTTFDDGSGAGDELYAGGRFNDAGGQVAVCLAKWNGASQSWSSVGGGTNNTVNALLGWEGSLYVGGQFDQAGGQIIRRVARWSGPSEGAPAGTWSALGLGVSPTSLWVRSFYVHQPQIGALAGEPVLCIGGHFYVIYQPGLTGSNLGFGVWDGTQWRPQGHGLNGDALALATCEATGIVYAGGDFAEASGFPIKKLAQWDGTAWSSVGNVQFNGTPSTIQAILLAPQGQTCELYVGGSFTGVNGNGSPGVARFDGTTWSALGSGLAGAVYDMRFYDDPLVPGGPQLYACGSTSVVSRWNGTTWTQVGAIVGFSARELEVFDDGQGAGPTLYVCGDSFVRRWNGTTWDSLGSFNAIVRALEVFDDGSGNGPALYAGGSFNMVDGAPAAQLIKWNGASWVQVGSGFDGPSFPNPFITSLHVWNNPPHLPAKSVLVAGGDFTSAGRVPANNVALWDGTQWTALGEGVDDRVWALLIANQSDGPALFVGGWFDNAGGWPSAGIARWNCQDSPLPGDVNGDATVNVDDLLAVINAWGPCPGACPADLNDNGTVDVDDLLLVINNWD